MTVSANRRIAAVKGLALALGLAGCIAGAAFPATADTILSVKQTSYDGLNRPVCSVERMNPSAFATVPADACALGTPGTFGQDRVTQTLYDAASQVTEIDRSVGDLNQKYARYYYNPNGTKHYEVDANGNTTEYLYDGFDRLNRINYPSTTTGSGASNSSDYEQFGYDANGNKTSWRRRNNKTISYTFDALDRETVRSVSDNSVQPVYTGYDALGHVLYARYGSTTGAGITNTYDSMGRLSTAIDANNRSVAYQYDLASNRALLTFPDNVQQSYVYSADNQLIRTGGYNGQAAIWFSYNDLGQRTNAWRDNSVNSVLGYDGLNRLTTYSHSLPDTTYNVGWTFSYNPASQIVNTAASSTVYDYAETTNGTVNSTYNGLNQDSGIAAVSGGGFDANGNLINDGARSMTYDAYNRLISVVSSAANLTLEYDTLGRLAKTTSVANGATTVTKLLYDGTNLIAEYDGNDVLTRRYMFTGGVDQPWVQFNGTGVAISDAKYMLTDYHGSVIALTGNTGSVSPSDLYKYGPYGEPKNASNVTSFAGARFRYTGQTVIPEASLYYYKARVYDPMMGRFLQTDPIGSKDDLDLYAYTGDDPIDHSDPSGTDRQYLDFPGSYKDTLGNMGDSYALQYAQGRYPVTYGAYRETSMFLAGAPVAEGVIAGVRGAVAFARGAESVWALGPATRGLEIEARLGGNLPKAFPTIDKFANGIATSIKSIDLAAPSYQSAGRLAGTLDRYVASVAKFNGASFDGTIIKAGQITGRELQVAVPQGSMSAAQQEVFDAAVQRAAQQNVKLITTQVK